MTDEIPKDYHTRFKFAVGCTIAAFGYLFFVPDAEAGHAFNFLMVVAGGFGLSKATQHLKMK